MPLSPDGPYSVGERPSPSQEKREAEDLLVRRSGKIWKKQRDRMEQEQMKSQVWWLMPVNNLPQRWGQDQAKGTFSDVVSSRPPWGTEWDSVSNQTKATTKLVDEGTGLWHLRFVPRDRLMRKCWEVEPWGWVNVFILLPSQWVSQNRGFSTFLLPCLTHLHSNNSALKPFPTISCSKEVHAAWPSLSLKASQPSEFWDVSFLHNSHCVVCYSSNTVV